MNQEFRSLTAAMLMEPVTRPTAIHPLNLEYFSEPKWHASSTKTVFMLKPCQVPFHGPKLKTRLFSRTRMEKTLLP